MRRGRPAAALLLLRLLAGTLPGAAAPRPPTEGTVAIAEERGREGPWRAVSEPERAGGEGGKGDGRWGPVAPHSHREK